MDGSRGSSGLAATFLSFIIINFNMISEVTYIRCPDNDGHGKLLNFLVAPLRQLIEVHVTPKSLHFW